MFELLVMGEENQKPSIIYPGSTVSVELLENAI